MSLSLVKIFKESFQNVRENWLEWLRVVFAPFVIGLIGYIFKIIICGKISQWSIPDTLKLLGETQAFGGYPSELILTDIVYNITQWIAFSSLLINGFRYATLKERGDRWWTLRVNWRFIKQILYNIFIFCSSSLYVFISMFIYLAFQDHSKNTALAVSLAVFLGFAFFYLVVRSGLINLLISIDQKKPLRLSWRLTKGNVLHLLGFSALVWVGFLFLGLIGIGVLGAIGWALYFVNPWLTIIAIIPLILFVLLVLFLFFAIGFKFMALVYEALEENMSKTSMHPSGFLRTAEEA